MSASPIDEMKHDEAKKKSGIIAFLRTNFIAGVLFVAPVLITFYIIKIVVQLLDKMIGSLVPSKYELSNFLPYDIFGVEILVGACALVVIGLVARNFIGRKLLAWAEALVCAIPGVRSIYSAVKQIVETLSASQSKSFREVVLVEYPRKGVWAIAFVTGKTKGEVQKLKDDELINVFLPTTPNPTSGFLLFIPKKDLRTLNMTVDQGLKMVISAGIVTPSMAEGKAAMKEEKVAAKEGVEAPKAE